MTRGDDDLQDTYFTENFTHGETCLKFDPIVSCFVLCVRMRKKNPQQSQVCRAARRVQRSLVAPARDAAPG